jgi:rhodanese-related sulfurtransferase
MTSPTEITAAQLARRIGLPDAPIIVDVRVPEDYDADPRLIPGAHRHDYRSAATWLAEYAGQEVVVACQKGLKLSQGVAALMRHEGISAQSLEGGSVAWAAAGLPLVRTDKLPKRDSRGRTVWVTRARPKVDRIACPWLIRRFVDPKAVFLFVAPSEVHAVADRFDAVPFDIDDVFWSHRGDTCTFDTMLTEFGLDTAPLQRLARIVRGADTARPELEPECAGLLAASLGYSRMFRDDLAQLDAAMQLYDALYRWCRDATEETHNWPAATPAGVPRRPA